MPYSLPPRTVSLFLRETNGAYFYLPSVSTLASNSVSRRYCNCTPVEFSHQRAHVTIKGQSEAAPASVLAAAAADGEAGSSRGGGRPSRSRSRTRRCPTRAAGPVGEDRDGPRRGRRRGSRGRREGVPPRRGATTRLGANATRVLGGRTGQLIIRGDVHRLRSLAAEVGGHGTQPRRDEGADRDS